MHPRGNRDLSSQGDQLSSTNPQLSSTLSYSASQNSQQTSQNSQPRYSRSDLGVTAPNFDDLFPGDQNFLTSIGANFSSQGSLHSRSDGTVDALNSDSNIRSDSSTHSHSGHGSSSSNSRSLIDSDSTSSSFPDIAIRAGTQIKPRETIQLFALFFQSFFFHDATTPYYIKHLHEILSSSVSVFNLDLSHFRTDEKWTPLFEALVYFPASTIPIADYVVNQLANDLRARWERAARDDQLQRQQNRRNGSGMNLHSDGMNSNSDAHSDMGFGLDSDYQPLEHIYHSLPLIVRPFGLELVNSRNLQPHDIDGLVSIRGIVLRVSTLKPELKIAIFPCNTAGCDNIINVEVSDGRLREPNFCGTCNKRDSFSLAHNMSRYASKQIIRIQEVPEDVVDGETPHTISICAYDELVDTVKPGDRIIVTGIFRGQSIRVNPNKRAVKSNLFTYLDAFHFKLVSAATKAQESNLSPHHNQGIGLDAQTNSTDTSTASGTVKPTLTEDEEAVVLALSQRPDIYSLLSRSIAPSVWGLDDVKKGLLAQLIGGNNIDGECSNGETDPAASHVPGARKRGKRGVIHVLLVGDPGTAKSQLLQYIHKLTTRGVYTSGTASSAAGLTASVMRDPVQNESVLEPGALVLSDCDICCIDEFDKMSGSAQSILHEAMEQQTVSIAKAGVICSLSARTTILASANPQDSRYNPKLSIVDNINLPPTLLSRFDLIYVILDTPHPQNDERLAEHLLSLFMNEEDRETFRQENIEKIEDTIGMLPKFTNTMGLDLTLPVNDSGQEFLPTANLMHYINYARSIIPVFSDEACFALEDCYLELRGVSSTNGNGTDLSNNGLLQSATGTSSHHTTISATPRQLQSLIRLAEALARAHLRDEVTKDDVKEATRLIRTATLASAIDPTTGRIDMNTITSGISSNDRNVFSSVLTIVEQILAENIRITNFDYHQLMNLVREHSPNVQTDIFNRVLNHLEATNRLEWRHSEGSVRIKQGVHIAHEESE